MTVHTGYIQYISAVYRIWTFLRSETTHVHLLALSSHYSLSMSKYKYCIYSSCAYCTRILAIAEYASQYASTTPVSALGTRSAFVAYMWLARARGGKLRVGAVRCHFPRETNACPVSTRTRSRATRSIPAGRATAPFQQFRPGLGPLRGQGAHSHCALCDKSLSTLIRISARTEWAESRQQHYTVGSSSGRRVSSSTTHSSGFTVAFL